MNAFREGSLYVTKRTLRRLKWIRATGALDKIYDSMAGTTERSQPTLDELADKLLNEYLEAKYTALVKAEKEYEKAEDHAIQTLKGETGE